MADAGVIPAPFLSIIIPTYQEASFIGPLVSHCLHQPGVLEVIVVDAASPDGTAQLAKDHGADVHPAVKAGRAPQMNQGAEVARGPVLHFIHADSWPPDGFPEAIAHAVSQDYAAGCFRSRFVTANRFLLANSYLTRFRGIVFRGGGQTLFCTAELFRQVGGYNRQLMVMEEYDLIQRLKQHTTFRIIPQNVRVSIRKYQERGAVRLQLAYGLIFILFFAGVSQCRLISLYKRLIA
jgi:Glycosyltransferases involved in cell wall biogenesis